MSPERGDVGHRSRTCCPCAREGLPVLLRVRVHEIDVVRKEHQELVARIALTRAVDRYGVGTLEQAFAGYKALPADTAADWRVVFFGANPPSPITVAAVDTAFRALAREK